MTGKLDVSKNGPSKLRLNEDGLDYAPVSLQRIPAGEYVPLMFTARNMVLEGANGELRGTYTVPSYRGSAFMDPRVGRVPIVGSMECLQRLAVSSHENEGLSATGGHTMARLCCV